MAARAQHDTLGNAHVTANDHRLEIQNPDLFTDPRVVTDDQFPWPVDAHAMADQDIVTDRGSEKP